MNINDCLQYLNIGLPEDIQQRKLRGDFEGALRLIEKRLAENNIPKALRNSLIAHREIIQHLPAEFPYSRRTALEKIRKYIPDFSDREFDEYVDKRKLRWIYLDGKEHFSDRFFETLCKVEHDFARRAGQKSEIPEGVNPLDVIIQKMKDNGSASQRIRIRATVKVRDDAFTPCMFVRVHLPIPSECDQQSDIRIEKIFPENGVVSPADAAQRTICWEMNLEQNQEFMVEYSYTHTERFVDAYHLTGTPGTYGFDLYEQQPHIVFSPYIKALCEELTEGISDPLLKAKAFYDFITLNMKYTYMPEYFVLDSIAESCARNYNGDCGVFALLFITLCRCAGIPAQWQSGLMAEPEEAGCHDWARFYVAPYGWLCCDPSFGIGAVRKGSEMRRQFYFGNIDPWRMVANREFQVNFTIPKEHWRADPYDNQSGEIETSDRGLTYDEIETSKTMLENYAVS